jgi:NitT/TauT family transport system ATP-binding protein
VMSKRPGRFLEKKHIELPRPRNLEITYTEKFSEIVLQLRTRIGTVRSS